MYTIVTKERNQLNIEDYSCRECNSFVDSGGLGIDFFNFFSNSKLSQHQHLHPTLAFRSFIVSDFPAPANQLESMQSILALVCWNETLQLGPIFVGDMKCFKKIESSERGSGQHVWGHLEYCEKTKAFLFLLGVTYKQAQSWTKFSAW